MIGKWSRLSEKVMWRKEPLEVSNDSHTLRWYLLFRKCDFFTFACPYARFNDSFRQCAIIRFSSRRHTVALRITRYSHHHRLKSADYNEKECVEERDKRRKEGGNERMEESGRDGVRMAPAGFSGVNQSQDSMHWGRRDACHSQQGNLSRLVDQTLILLFSVQEEINFPLFSGQTGFFSIQKQTTPSLRRNWWHTAK